MTTWTAPDVLEVVLDVLLDELPPQPTAKSSTAIAKLESIRSDLMFIGRPQGNRGMATISESSIFVRVQDLRWN
jgi:uncharacterized protein (DUF2267 family)